MRSDNLRLPCVQPPTSSHNFQLPHGHHDHHVRHGHGGHGGHGGRGEHDGNGQERAGQDGTGQVGTGRDGTGRAKLTFKPDFPDNFARILANFYSQFQPQRVKTLARTIWGSATSTA